MVVIVALASFVTLTAIQSVPACRRECFCM